MGDPIMPLNGVGQHVVQPKVIGSRSGSKTDSSAFPTPRAQSNHVPHLKDLVVLGGSSEVGTHTERRMRWKLQANPSAQASGVAPGEGLQSRRRSMTASPERFKVYVQQALKAH